jgi:hypothetical protein
MGDQSVPFDSLKRALAEILPGPEYFAELLQVMKDIRGQQVRPLQDGIEKIRSLRETGGTAHAHQMADNGNKDERDFEEHYYALLAQRRFPEHKSKCEFKYIDKDICEAQEKVICHLVGGDLRNSAGAARDLARRFGHPGLKDEKLKVGEIHIQQLQGDQELWHLVSKPRATENKYGNPGKFLKNHLAALIALREKVKENRLTEIAITKLGANKNRVAWKFTMRKLQEIFADVEVTFVVHSFVSKFVRRGKDAAKSAQTNKKDESGRRSTDEGHSTVASGSADGGCPQQPLSQTHPLGKPTPTRYDQRDKAEDMSLTEQYMSTNDENNTQSRTRVETREDGEKREETPTSVQGLADGGCPLQPSSTKHPLGEPSPTRYENRESGRTQLLTENPVSLECDDKSDEKLKPNMTNEDGRGNEVTSPTVQGLAGGGSPDQLPPLRTNTPPRQTLHQKVISGKPQETCANKSFPRETAASTEAANFLSELGKMRKSLQAMESKITSTPPHNKEKPKITEMGKKPTIRSTNQKISSHPMAVKSNRRMVQ